MKIRSKEQSDRTWLKALLRNEWGGDSFFVRGSERGLLDKPTLIAGKHEGVAIYEPG